MILVKCLQILRDRILVVETLWYKDGHCLWQAESTHHQELEHVVEAGRVAHAVLYDGADVLDITQRLAAQHTLTSLHPTAIATDGVDLTIMSQQTERLCQFPLGESVG